MLPSKAVPYATLKSSTFRAYPLARRYWPDRSFFTCVVRYGGVGGEGEAGPCAGEKQFTKNNRFNSCMLTIIVDFFYCTDIRPPPQQPNDNDQQHREEFNIN